MNKGDFQIPIEFNDESNIESVMVTHEIDEAQSEEQVIIEEEHNDNDSIINDE